MNLVGFIGHASHRSGSFCTDSSNSILQCDGRCPPETGHEFKNLLGDGEHSDDCDQSFQRIATSVTRVRDGTVG